MPSCPRCGKRFVDQSRILKHMNQPASSCLTYYEELLRLNEALTAEKDASAEAPYTENSSGVYQQNVEDSLPSHSSLDEAHSSQMEVDPPSNQDSHGHSSAEQPSTRSSQPYREDYPGAAKIYGTSPTFMDIFNSDVHSAERKNHPYYPFASKEEWELASFLLRSDLSMKSIDKFLKLQLVSCWATVTSALTH